MNGVICAQTGPAFVWPTGSRPSEATLECSFQGKVTEPITDFLVLWLEERSLMFSIPTRQRKRVVRVGTELVQNLFHHAPLGTENDTRFLAVSTPSRWLISTCNRVDGSTKELLASRLNGLQAQTPEERRNSHRFTLAQGTRSRHGGGGVGFQEILRKTNGQLRLEFLPFDRNSWLAIFTAQIEAPHE